VRAAIVQARSLFRGCVRVHLGQRLASRSDSRYANSLAGQAKKHFGGLIDAARLVPVAITKYDDLSAGGARGDPRPYREGSRKTRLAECAIFLCLIKGAGSASSARLSR